MTIQYTTPNLPIVPPTSLRISSGNGVLKLNVTWDHGVVPEPNSFGCDPRILDATIPVTDRNGRIEPHPERKLTVDVVRVDSILGESEPTRVTQPMLLGFVEALRDSLDHVDHDVRAITSALAQASPKVRFTMKDCPFTFASTPVQLGL